MVREKVFKEKLREWGICKNLKKRHYQYMIKVERKRWREGKKTMFRYRGEVVESRKLERAGRSTVITHSSTDDCKFYLRPL